MAARSIAVVEVAVPRAATAVTAAVATSVSARASESSHAVTSAAVVKGDRVSATLTVPPAAGASPVLVTEKVTENTDAPMTPLPDGDTATVSLPLSAGAPVAATAVPATGAATTRAIATATALRQRARRRRLVPTPSGVRRAGRERGKVMSGIGSCAIPDRTIRSDSRVPALCATRDGPRAPVSARGGIRRSRLGPAPPAPPRVREDGMLWTIP
ncbi:hypothetical protein IC744_10915 [Microbacterium hominis]|uniref:hypothetical protein n=1 Tax=Microbacterium hominis TaxID=162426 RepID=UPI00168A555B|nr:hypothetical protein [Microbacterium hominis]QOC27968.1 hypothetical protein IC744_10915 [Microbacterium hominis]